MNNKQSKLLNFVLLVVIIFFGSCMPKKKKVDLLVTNATIYTVDSTFSKITAMAIEEGKIVAIGSNDEINKSFVGVKSIDAKGKFIYPGFYDAHAHLYGLGMSLQKVNLKGTNSFEDVLKRVVEFQNEKKLSFIQGRGWDQNDWENKKFPNRKELDVLFPDVPVVLTRIDGHAMLVNGKALELAKINPYTKVDGGQVEVINGEVTGILVDNAMDKIQAILPLPDKKTNIQAFKDAQKEMFHYGITTVNEAGLEPEIIELIDELHKKKELAINIYAMIAVSQKNLDLYLEKGIYKTDKLNVSSFKFMGDGALGSRGACLHKAYTDAPKQFGALLTPVEQINKIARRIAASPFQMNSHAIGDSTNTLLLKIYKEVLMGKEDRRWKIEHAQIMREEDFEYFSLGIIPSVQPTHATSDMYWAQDRVGVERIKTSYAYKKMLDKAGIIALGTDFPIEEVNPMFTFYAAVARKDLKNFPKGGFQIENALTREETLKGMTIWAAYSNFEEKEKGSLEIGKWADFVIFSEDLMHVDIEKIPHLLPQEVYVKGEKVK